MNTVELPIAAQEEQDEETALAMTALKIVHGQTLMLPTKSILKALHNSHVRTFQQINEILDEKDSNPYSRLARIRKLTEKAGKPEVEGRSL